MGSLESTTDVSMSPLLLSWYRLYSRKTSTQRHCPVEAITPVSSAWPEMSTCGVETSKASVGEAWSRRDRSLHPHWPTIRLLALLHSSTVEASTQLCSVRMAMSTHLVTILRASSVLVTACIGPSWQWTDRLVLRSSSMESNRLVLASCTRLFSLTRGRYMEWVPIGGKRWALESLIMLRSPISTRLSNSNNSKFTT